MQEGLEKCPWYALDAGDAAGEPGAATFKYFLLFGFAGGPGAAVIERLQEVRSYITYPEPQKCFAIRFCPDFAEYVGDCWNSLAVWFMYLAYKSSNFISTTGDYSNAQSPVFVLAHFLP